MTLQHAFVIPAYGNSPHLAACIRSLKAQSVGGSEIRIVTSTPSSELAALASELNVPLTVNVHPTGIARDWNSAIQATEAPWVTLAHQDDVYEPDYCAHIFALLARYPGAVLAFSNYREITAQGLRRKNLTLRIKEILVDRAFQGRDAICSEVDKLRLLSWGNPVCCPSVTFNRPALGAFEFAPELSINLDWEAWIGLARRVGCFAYYRWPLVLRRIHASSETSAGLVDQRRQFEDRLVFRRLWPAPIAALIAFAYRLSYRTNSV